MVAKQAAGEGLLEVDQENQTIRLKEGWEKVRRGRENHMVLAPRLVVLMFPPPRLLDVCVQWLMPNAAGGMGAPRWERIPPPLPGAAAGADDAAAADAGGRPAGAPKRRPRPIAVPVDESSCRDSTSGESRDSDDALDAPLQVRPSPLCSPD